MAVLGVDVGGAFTDAVLLADGTLTTAKVPTRLAQEESVVEAARLVLEAADNTETSSRITDVVLSAFGGAVDVPAQGAGTMSNTTFGTDVWTYYETLGGGQGAGPCADGPSAVHVAMSNALNTPVEALELAYPLRVERYALRRGSGGDGRHRGGDGVVREIRALAPCRLSVLGDRRRHPPRGAEGGADGARGRTLVNGEEIPGKDSRSLESGDLLRTETPGGGGWGR